MQRINAHIERTQLAPRPPPRKIGWRDWLMLLGLVRNRRWTTLPSRERPFFIRDSDGRCPICALAYEVSGGEVNYVGLAHSAAREAFGTHRGIDALVSAADNPRHPLRRLLEFTLGMRSPK